MLMKTLMLSSVLAFGTLAVPAGADDGIRIVVRGGGHHGDHHGGPYYLHSRPYDRSYAAHRYRHYERPYAGYLWTHHRYLRHSLPDHRRSQGHDRGQGPGRGRGGARRYVQAA